MKIDKQALVKNFDEASSRYDDVAILQKTVLERLLDRLQFLKLEPKTILDLGSGTGQASLYLKQLYPKAEIIELDLSLAMLNTSRTRASRGLFTRRNRYLCADQESLPLHNKSMDLIVSSLSFQWSEDLGKTISEATKSLKPNGLLLFSSLGAKTLHELKSSWAEVDDMPHVNDFYDIRDIGDKLTRQGLHDPVLDSEIITLTYSSCQDLFKDLKQTGVSNVQSNRHKGLMGKKQLKKLISAYEAYREEGRLPASYEVIYAHAWSLSNEEKRKQDEFAFPLSELTKRDKY